MYVIFKQLYLQWFSIKEEPPSSIRMDRLRPMDSHRMPMDLQVVMATAKKEEVYTQMVAAITPSSSNSSSSCSNSNSSRCWTMI